MQLLERDAEVAAFAGRLEAAAEGRGSVLLVSGEAGIGKSGLVQAFAATARDRARWIEGACDDLLTPRTLGPFRDMAASSVGPLSAALAADVGLEGVLAAVMAELVQPPAPTVAVVEDAHWADETTLDVLRVAGRRIGGLPAVLIVTYRDELPVDHALLPVVGALHGEAVLRLPLHRLSPRAVADMAATAGRAAAAADAADLHEITGGNPFFVTEVLAADGADVPRSIQDSVAGRVGLLPAHARRGLELLAVSPSGLRPAQLAALAAVDEASLSAAERLGLVELIGGRVRFRHELMRRAVERMCTSAQLVSAHALLLETLREQDVEPSRLLHHAVGAGDAQAIVGYAPVAARQAGRMGSHSDALTYLEWALVHHALMDTRTVAELRRRFADELYLADRHEAAAREAAQSVRLWEALGDAPELGKALVELSHVSYWALDADTATEAGLRSVQVLAGVGPSPALAAAYANVAFVHAMRSRNREAFEAGRRGAELAARFGRSEVRAFALAQQGAAKLLSGDPAGRAILLEALDESRRAGAHRYVSMCCTWLVLGLTRLGRVDEVEPYIDLGVGYADQHEVRVGATQLRMLRCELALRRGHHGEAERGLRELGSGGVGTGWGENVAVSLLGRILTRHGDPKAAATVRSAWDVAHRAGDVHRVGPAGIALAEWGWTTGRFPEVRAGVAHAVDVARCCRHSWFLGELLRYCALAHDGALADDGMVAAGDADLDERWAAGLRGDWRAAAAGWERTGWPFERALELSMSGDQMLEGLSELDELDVPATADRIRRMLRERGLQRLPRGPLPQTRHNPAGLTPRQFEVVQLIAANLTNAQIADRLVISVRTVDHHVSAIFDKLGVQTRREAVERIRALGVLSLPGEGTSGPGSTRSTRPDARRG
ncbi:MAG: ATP-binding protein [Frankiaceae bacterium]